MSEDLDKATQTDNQAELMSVTKNTPPITEIMNVIMPELEGLGMVLISGQKEMERGECVYALTEFKPFILRANIQVCSAETGRRFPVKKQDRIFVSFEALWSAKANPITIMLASYALASVTPASANEAISEAGTLKDGMSDEGDIRNYTWGVPGSYSFSIAGHRINEPGLMSANLKEAFHSFDPVLYFVKKSHKKMLEAIKTHTDCVEMIDTSAQQLSSSITGSSLARGPERQPDEYGISGYQIGLFYSGDMILQVTLSKSSFRLKISTSRMEEKERKKMFLQLGKNLVAGGFSSSLSITDEDDTDPEGPGISWVARLSDVDGCAAGRRILNSIKGLSDTISGLDLQL